MQKAIYLLAGVTASGKSSLAIELAHYIGAVIVNADSRQVYRELKIGSAQPTPDQINQDNSWEINGVKHYLYGHKELDEEYTVVAFQKEALSLIKKIDKPIIFVGGSGLFIDSVGFQYKFPKAKENPQTTDYSSLSIEQLTQLLPVEVVKNISESDIKNRHRLIQILSRGLPGKKGGPIFAKYFVLSPDIENLEARIARRTEKMFQSGLLAEVEALWAKYPGFNHPGLKTIGYREFIPYFNGESSVEEVKNMIILHTRQYAKRQRTWFRRNKEAIWITEPDIEDIKNLL